jgi:hypothetical protein
VSPDRTTDTDRSIRNRRPRALADATEAMMQTMLSGAVALSMLVAVGASALGTCPDKILPGTGVGV